MATICDALIDRMVEVNCVRAKGFKATGVLINYDDMDWANCVRNASHPSVFTTIALLDGKKGYKVKQESNNAFDGTQTELNVGDFSSTFTNTASFKLFGGDVSKSEVATILAKGTFVLVLEQKDRSDDDTVVGAGSSTYRIYGVTNGLTASAIANTPNGDNGNIWEVTLTEEGSIEAANYLFDTDAATTKAKFDSLTA